MKSFNHIRSLVEIERPKQPVPANMISIVPGGMSILRQMYEHFGQKLRCHGNQHDRRHHVSRYGLDNKFRDWMFANYSAEIVQHDGNTMIRFMDEQQMLMFVLKHGA